MDSSLPPPVSLTYSVPVPVALPITTAQLLSLGITSAQIGEGQARGEAKTHGPWQIASSYRALCLSRDYVPQSEQRYSAETRKVTVHGMRTLGKLRPCGYDLEGRVSVNGRSVRGFTSSQLFEVMDQGGKLIDCAVIHACEK